MERDEAKEEAQLTRITVVTPGDVKAWVEDNLATVQDV